MRSIIPALLAFLVLAGCSPRQASTESAAVRWQEQVSEGRAATEAGDLPRATASFRGAVEISLSFGTADPKHAASLALLAGVLAAAGQTDEAERLDRAVIESCEKSGNITDGSYATALHGLALLSEEKDVDKAIGFAQRAISVIEKSVGGDVPELAVILCDVARMHGRAGAMKAAEAALLRALALLERCAPGSPEIADVLEPLASIKATQGLWQEALSDLEKAVAIRRQAPSADPARMGITLFAYAEVMRASGDASKAEIAYRAALTHWEFANGPDHVDLAPLLNGLASVLAQNQKFSEAESTFVRAERIVTREFGSEDANLVPVLQNRALMYSAWEKWPQAIADRGRILAIAEHTTGSDSRDYVVALNDLIAAHALAGEINEAITLNRQAIAIVQRNLGPSDPNLGIALQNCAMLLAEGGRNDEAEEMRQKARVIDAR
jgi:tetratricopeptide (TPR) repeat protein